MRPRPVEYSLASRASLEGKRAAHGARRRNEFVYVTTKEGGDEAVDSWAWRVRFARGNCHFYQTSNRKDERGQIKLPGL